MAYASRTGTRRNLAVLRAYGWRLIVSARGALRTEGFGYGLDNGAWTAHQRGEPFEPAAFERAVALLGADADWIVLPDIVAGGLASLDFSLSWLPRLRGIAPLLLAVQDGIGKSDVADLIGPDLGIFIGGSTAWKETTLPTWGQVARDRGAYLHVGRVNSARRIALCAAAGADSFDGSSVTRFAVTIGRLDAARRQPALPFDGRNHDEVPEVGRCQDQ